MNAHPAGGTQQPEPPQQPMSSVHMLSTVVGVLLGATSIGILGSGGSIPWALVALAAGLTMILVGATGLGGRLQPAAAPGTVSHGATPPYPALLEGQLAPGLSRWMWLVKWLLAAPHYIVLAVLWVAFVVVTLAAAVIILFTGRYPASLFQFTVGVMRWNWRVTFYASGVLGTDRYPPFTLARTVYPATFEVAYPERLSRWKVLVKSWLLALPHLLIITAITGGIATASTGGAVNGFSLLGVLVIITGLILLFTGAYRKGLFNLLMGIHRWMYRTMAYAALLRDDYPPFRLDQGAVDPASRRTATS